jgi:hypothetical protein
MEKATERMSISFSKEDIKRMDDLKIPLNQKTYSKVTRALIRLHRK